MLYIPSLDKCSREKNGVCDFPALLSTIVYCIVYKTLPPIKIWLGGISYKLCEWGCKHKPKYPKYLHLKEFDQCKLVQLTRQWSDSSLIKNRYPEGIPFQNNPLRGSDQERRDSGNTAVVVNAEQPQTHFGSYWTWLLFNGMNFSIQTFSIQAYKTYY